MARKPKVGLDYYPHNCTLDDSISYIIALHKEQGYYVYFRLLEHIYSQDGYFCNWDKKNIVLFANKINIDIDILNNIIKDCLDENLFNNDKFNKYSILTSKGIQERYFIAIDRRKEGNLINEYKLIDNVYIKGLNVYINCLNVDRSTQSKVKESKVKESKEQNVKYKDFTQSLILEYFPNIELNFNAQVKVIRDLVEIDKRTSKDIKKALRNAKEDEFWNKQILSLTKLRKKNKDDVKYIDVFLQLQQTKELKTIKYLN